MMQTFYPLAFNAASDCGLVRSQNEDFWEAREGCFVLADGMGGHNAGEVAAKMAVESFIQGEFPPEREPLEAAVKRAVKKANQEVFHAGLENAEWQGMGTTLTALVFVDKLVALGHVGDSRAYRLREERLKQLTVDHTVMNRMRGVKEAVLFKHVLTRAIGTQETVIPQVQSYPVHAGDLYLLCSDGLNNHFSDAEILEVLRASSQLEEKNRYFVEKCNARGGSDNVTLVLIEVGA